MNTIGENVSSPGVARLSAWPQSWRRASFYCLLDSAKLLKGTLNSGSVLYLKVRIRTSYRYKHIPKCSISVWENNPCFGSMQALDFIHCSNSRRKVGNR